MSTRTLGAFGERLAARHLEQQGMTILDRNWRAAVDDVRGELDLVAANARTLVVCEVKTRRGPAAGDPLEAVTPDKVARLRRLAAAWLAAHPGPHPGSHAGPWEGVRIDVIGVSWRHDGRRARIEHVRGVGQ